MKCGIRETAADHAARTQSTPLRLPSAVPQFAPRLGGQTGVEDGRKRLERFRNRCVRCARVVRCFSPGSPAHAPPWRVCWGGSAAFAADQRTA